MSVYIIAQIDIRDRDTYAKYQAGFAEVFEKYDGELLVVDDAAQVVEGEWPYSRTVVIRFPNADEAARWYGSPEYQAIAKHRLAASQANAVIVQGFEPDASQ
jgi:uncharacterized protein (DUF1330 family)